MCSNKSYSDVKGRVEDAGIEVDTVIENVGDLIREGEEETRRVKRQVTSMDWDSYQRCGNNNNERIDRGYLQYKAVTVTQLEY